MRFAAPVNIQVGYEEVDTSLIAGWQIVKVLRSPVKGKDYQIDRERRTCKNKRDHGNGDTSFRKGVHSQAGEHLY